MRIAILGSVATKIPPDGQAAIERLAYHQVLGLAKRGYQILLFALKGSKVSHANVRVVEVGDGETLLGVGKEDTQNQPEKIYGSSYKLRLEILNLSRVLDKLITLKDDYDIVLNNLRGEAVVIPLAKLLNKHLYHVMHLPLFPQLAELFRENHTKLISISNAQRKAFPNLNYVATVYNGVDASEFDFSDKPGSYLLYLGSIGANKNPKDAILAAREAGETILIGGRIKDVIYYEKEIKPLIDDVKVKWVGEKHPSEVIALYKQAKAFLFPTLWEEPFGLVCIEALSCGTPVIAYPNGALTEIVKDGVNGFLVHNITEMVQKIKEIERIKRENCRKTVEEKFTIEKMVETYEKVLLSSLNKQ